MPRGGKREGAGRPRKRPLEAATKVAPKKGEKTDPERSLEQAIAAAKDLTVRLLDELDAVTTHVGEIEDLIADETAADRDTRRRDAMLKAVGLGARAGILRVLLAASRAWSELEQRGAAVKLGKKEMAQQRALAPAPAGSDWADLDDDAVPH
jgi:hypothetical protein